MLPLTPIAVAFIILKVTVITVPLAIAFYILETYLDRRRTRKEAPSRDPRRANEWP